MISNPHLRTRGGSSTIGREQSTSCSQSPRPSIVVTSSLVIVYTFLLSTAHAGAAVPPSETAAYIYQQKQQTVHGASGTNHQPPIKSKTSTTTTQYDTTRSPSTFGLSSRLNDAVGSRSTLRHRIAASSPQVHPYDASSPPSSTAHPIVKSGLIAGTSISKAKSPPTAPSSHAPTTAGLSPKAILFMSLLSLQFGLQPLLVRRFTPTTINKSTVVFTQEIIKLIISVYAYLGSTTREQQRADWGDGGRPHLLVKQLAIAGLPAALYCVQNIVSLLAYQNLDPVSYNVLNQSKTLSAALCCYLVMGARQSCVQIMALGLLLGSALVLEKILPVSMLIPGLGGAVSGAAGAAGGGTGILATLGNMVSSLTSGGMTNRVTHGVLPILLASFLSGLAGALVQKAVQGGGRQVRRLREEGEVTGKVKQPKNFYLFSTELGIVSIFLLLVSFAFSGDGRRIVSHGFFADWTPATLVPIMTQSFGGICVGLVTKHAGSVRKGFALIFGMLLSGMVTARGAGGLGVEQMLGLFLASTSLFLHTRYPYRKPQALAASAA